VAQRLVLWAEPGGGGGTARPLPHPHRLAEGGGSHLRAQTPGQMWIGSASRQLLSELAACVFVSAFTWHHTFNASNS
jgi:hypothetical protein